MNFIYLFPKCTEASTFHNAACLCSLTSSMFGAGIDTCVLIEGKEGRSSSWYYAVGHPAVFSRVRVICCYLDNGGSRGTMGTKADCVEDWIEGRSVVIDVHH